MVRIILVRLFVKSTTTFSIKRQDYETATCSSKIFGSLPNHLRFLLTATLGLKLRFLIVPDLRQSSLHFRLLLTRQNLLLWIALVLLRILCLLQKLLKKDRLL